MQTRSGGRKSGAPSRWKVAPRLGDMWGGRSGFKREREEVSMGERWRAVGYRSWGMEKRNERLRKKCRSNFGAEDIDKRVIVKKAAESRV